MLGRVEACVSVLAALSLAACTSGEPERVSQYREAAKLRAAKLQSSLETSWQLAHDRFGIRFARPLADASVQTLIKKLGLKLVSEHDARLASFALPQQLEASEIWKLCARIEKDHAKLVTHAGAIETFGKASQFGAPVRLITDELIFEFAVDTTKQEAELIAKELSVKILQEHPYVANQYLGVVPLAVDPRAVAKQFEMKGARFAHPNYVLPDDVRAVIPSDTYFRNQWHHRNDGSLGGTLDADIDTPEAWDFSSGARSWPLVAVIENKPFDLTHPDYVEGIAGSEMFRDCEIESGRICESFVPSEGAHATAVAGLVGARANGLGVVGVCPECPLLLIAAQGSVWSKALAFDYALAQGAEIVTNSWGIPGEVPPNLSEAITRVTTEGRGGLGSVVLFAMHTTPGWTEDCAGSLPDISARADVIAVSAATSSDERASAGYGNCMDVIAPADLGTRFIVTTDVQGLPGINSEIFHGALCGGVPDFSNQDYTLCFGGTSAATPIAAGVAALALAQRPDVSRVAIQRLLQDTADKIDPRKASYDARTGFSSPAAPPAPDLPVGSTHGYGRVNAFEATWVVGSRLIGGRGGVDVFMRDNALDFGNTERPSNVLMNAVRGFIPHWESVDIKIDAPPFEGAAPTPQNFDSYPDEPAAAGVLNHVYVRVHNRGVQPATDVTVRLYWTFAGTALPELPFDFWGRFPREISGPTWHSIPQAFPLGRVSVHYSGASVAGSADDRSRIIRFEFTAPELDFERRNPHHHCLLAIADTGMDRILGATNPVLSVDVMNPRDNNVTQRNIQVVSPGMRRSLPYQTTFFVNNPTGSEAAMMLRAEIPKGWQVGVAGVPLDAPFAMKQGAQILAELKVYPPSQEERGTVRIWQELIGLKQNNTVLGGLTYRFD